MAEKQVTVQLKAGLQARQAALFVQEANRYSSEVFVEKDNKKVNAKSIMGIMSLAVSRGAKVVISATGVDEERAVNGLVSMIEEEN